MPKEIEERNSTTIRPLIAAITSLEVFQHLLPQSAAAAAAAVVEAVAEVAADAGKRHQGFATSLLTHPRQPDSSYPCSKEN